jgi:D-beta-D-heptose 7-phosphate kinase/D-beta-D-heptose 1-phosphate adenosyltransferase
MIAQLHEVIREIEHEWAGKRLLVVGDVMLDKYIWGEVGRISPEAPVPVVRATHRSEQPGGAANVAMNLARLGAQTHAMRTREFCWRACARMGFLLSSSSPAAFPPSPSSAF